MKRLIVLLSISIFCFTGCSVYKLDNTNIGKNIKILLSHKTKMHNVNYDGYRYYLPKGVSFVSKDEYNAVFKDSNSNIYYMFVDALSYYNKIENTYKVKKNTYYSQRLDYNKKDGYLQIDEVDSKYFIQYVFHYAKMEAYVDKEDLISSLQYISSVLRSVKYNNKVLRSIIGEKVLDYKEENYTLFKADSSKENFLDVVEM